MLGGTVACQPWRWPGDPNAAQKLATSAEVKRESEEVVSVDRDLRIRFRKEERAHPDGPSILTVRRCDGPLDSELGKALSVWLPERACVAQIDQRPNGDRWLGMRDVFPLTRVYADPLADSAKVRANLRDNAQFAADAMEGALKNCKDVGPGELLCVIKWGGCIIMEDWFYFRVIPRVRGGSFVVIELVSFVEGDPSAWRQAEVL
jgi:hypothetical protein